MTAAEDKELWPWFAGIQCGKPHRAGSFLNSLADAAMRADHDNYRILRPALVEIKAKFEEYWDPRADW
jgi:hypothetical protein